ncbi:DUF2182 domain-containing protein [Ectothiorhodospiraceae bacterium WFHF3C12]|nr:DUF2182 domain-containing protein [Ectothiorhodospiraceae bacterium WFHF3C12]
MTRLSPRAVLWRDRMILISSLVLLAALSWWYMVDMALDMGTMASAEGAGHRMSSWTLGEFFLVFVMWAVMMVAMMLPAASPMIFAYSSIARRHASDRPMAHTWTFVCGYFVVWTAFSAGVTLLQWQLHQAAVLSAMGVSTTPYLAAALLLGAGLFQFTPLKHACLHKCRSPVAFLLTEWRPGTAGAFNMGVKHGYTCAACCWSLMLLMFVLGTMNIWWMFALTVFFVLEKVGPAPQWLGRFTGVALIAWAAVVASS